MFHEVVTKWNGLCLQHFLFLLFHLGQLLILILKGYFVTVEWLSIYWPIRLHAFLWVPFLLLLVLLSLPLLTFVDVTDNIELWVILLLNCVVAYQFLLNFALYLSFLLWCESYDVKVFNCKCVINNYQLPTIISGFSNKFFNFFSDILTG